MNLEEKFSQLIKNELPAKVGKELQEVLLQAEKDAKELHKLLIEHVKLEELCKKKENIIIDLNNKLGEHSHIDTKITDLEKREKNLKVRILEIQLEEANKRADMAKDFTSGLVRNTLFRKTIFDSENNPIAVTDQYGNVGTHYANSTKSLQETQSEE